MMRGPPSARFAKCIGQKTSSGSQCSAARSMSSGDKALLSRRMSNPAGNPSYCLRGCVPRMLYVSALLSRGPVKTVGRADSLRSLSSYIP